MIKVRRTESVADILTTNDGATFSIIADLSEGLYKLEQLKPEIPETPELRDSKGESEQTVKLGEEMTPLKHATRTPIVARTTNLAIREGPLNDLLKLETVDVATARPVIHEWYPLVTKSTTNNYVDQYVRWMHSQGLIDDDGRILKEEKPAIPPELEKELKEAIKKPDAEDEEDEGPKIPNPKDLTVITTRGDTTIYLEPLNEILQLDTVDIAALDNILIKYYDSSRPALMYVIRRDWKRFLDDRQFLDKDGRPTRKNVTLGEKS